MLEITYNAVEKLPFFCICIALLTSENVQIRSTKKPKFLDRLLITLPPLYSTH